MWVVGGLGGETDIVASVEVEEGVVGVGVLDGVFCEERAVGLDDPGVEDVF